MKYRTRFSPLGHPIVGLMSDRHGPLRGIRKAISVALCFALLVPSILYSVAYAQDIVPDTSKTNTTISYGDNVTDIYTTTKSGQNAFNWFQKFNVSDGHTVNLHLPSGADNLLNLVYSEEYPQRSYIGGILNSVKDGQIGGNVFFLNPNGLVVGAEGVVNAGSFTAFTPTLSFMDSFFGSDGTPSSSKVSQVMDGTVPIGSSGLITVQGKVNAINDIKLSAGNVSVESTGLVQTGAVFQASSPGFTDVVNANGLERATVIVNDRGNIEIRALNDISVTGGTVASGGVASVDAGAIAFEAGNSISVSGQILAEWHGDNSTSGDIKLTVQQEDHANSELTDAAASITLSAATLKGNNIELKAQSDAKYEFSNELASLITSNMDSELGYELDVDVAVARAKAESKIEIGSGSVLEAKGNVTLTADATATAEVTAKDKTKQEDHYFGIGFIYGEINSVANVAVQSGATIRATNLSLSAKNTATLDVAVQTVSEQSNSAEAAIAVTYADVAPSATTAQGASILVTDKLSITATNENSFSTSSTAKARDNGVAGIAAAFFSATTQATAASDANLSGLTNLIIQAVDDTTKNMTTASGIAGGTETTTMLLRIGKNGASFISDKLRKQEPQQLDPKVGPTEDDGTSKGPKLAGAVSISEATQGATARIGAGAVVDVGNSVVVAAQIQVASLQNKAESSVVSKEEHSATESLSAAVAYGKHELNAEAFIGSNAQVKAQYVGVRSDVIVHLSALDIGQFDRDKLTSFSTIIEGLKELKDIAGAPLLTSYANATESAEDLGIAGPVTYMDIANTSKAYLAKGAKVTLKPTATDTWATTMPNARELSWTAPLSISANADLIGVFAAGNFSLGLSGTGGEEGAASAGGAYNHVNNTNTTKAFIAAGASVLQAEGQETSEYSNVSVAAHTDQVIIAFAPTAGRTGNYGLNGAFSLANIDSTTEASVSDKASVTTRKLEINGREDVVSWSLTGALSRAQSAGVGVSVAINDVSTNTRAFIGPNSEDPTGDDSLPQGVVSAQTVDVEAVTDGAIHTYSVAMAAATSGDPPNPDQEPGRLEKVRKKLSDAIAKLTGKTERRKDASGPGGSSDEQAEPKFGLAISGSSSVNLGKPNTEAYVYKAELSLLSPEGADSALSIRGVNSTDIIAASGGATLAKAGNKSAQWSAGVAGAVTYNELRNTTSASLRESTVTGAKKVAVQGLAAGLQVSVALGVAVNASADQEKAASAAGSVSISDVSNKVESAIEDSTVEGPSKGPNRALDVVAYDRTTIGTGGGSLVAGGKGGFGAAVTYSNIANTVDARIIDPKISAYDVVRVHGLTAALIGSGGAMGGFTKGEQSITLARSVVINLIANIISAQVLGSPDDYSYTRVDDDIDVLARDTKDHAMLDDIIRQRSRGDVPQEEADEDKTDYSGRDLFTDDQSDDGDQSDSDDGTRIISVAGVVQASGSNVGISFAWNEVEKEFQARVDMTLLEAGRGTNVEAQGGTSIVGAAVGVGVATGKFAGVASVTVNETRNTIKAEVSDSTVYHGSLTVKATDKTQIHSLSGQVAAGTGKASAGGAIAHNLIGNTVTARLRDASVYHDDDDLDAEAASALSTNQSKIRTLSAGGTGAASLAFEVSVSSAHVHNTTIAEVEYSDTGDEEGGDGSDWIRIYTDSLCRLLMSLRSCRSQEELRPPSLAQ